MIILYEIQQDTFVINELSDELYNRFVDVMEESVKVLKLLDDVYHDS